MKRTLSAFDNGMPGLWQVLHLPE